MPARTSSHDRESEPLDNNQSAIVEHPPARDSLHEQAIIGVYAQVLLPDNHPAVHTRGLPKTRADSAGFKMDGFKL